MAARPALVNAAVRGPLGAANGARAVAVEPIVARVLGIPLAAVGDGLAYHTIAQWDSLRHVALMIALEEAFGTRITDELTLQLHSVGAIRAFARTRANSPALDPPPAEPPPAAEPAPVTLHRGLDGVYVDRSTISRIDGANGVLEYRGYRIEDLLEHASFEETAWLLLHGELPEPAQREAFAAELRRERALPGACLAVLRAVPGARPVDALRTAVSALGSLDADARDDSPAAFLRAGTRLIARLPTLIAAHHAIRTGHAPVAPRADLSHAANLLWMLTGRAPSRREADLIERDLIVHADHGSNASAFAARVAVGCRADLHAAVTAAIATFSGPLHGGAAEGVMDLVDAVGTPQNAGTYVRARLAANQPVMGFGHRVYRAQDPRARYLRTAARELGRELGDTRGFAIVEALVEAMEPYARHGVAANVDLYAGLIYRLLGLPDDLVVPLFLAGRIAGLVAQAAEQSGDNVLIRPLLHYVGATGRAYPRPGDR